MRIVIVSYSDLTGPGVIHAYHFANELARRGHKIVFLLNGSKNTTRLMAELPLFDLLEIRFSGMFLDKKIVSKIKHFAPDIIHIWTPRHIPARVGLELKYHTKAKLIVHYEDNEDFIYDSNRGRILEDFDYFVETIKFPMIWDNKKHPIITYLANVFADSFTAICPSLLRALKEKWSQDVHLLYPGVDLQRFNTKIEGTKWREKYSLHGKKIVLYAGSVSYMHDFDILLTAMKEVKKHYPNAVLVHIGRIQHKHEVRKMVRKLGIYENVIFFGPVAHKEMPGILAMGDIMAQTGRINSFNRFRLPSKIPEYMAMGKPIITFGVGFGELLKENVEIVKTHTDDPKELAEKIMTLIEDDLLCKRLKQNARLKAEELFDINKNSSKLEKIYSEIMNEEKLHRIISSPKEGTKLTDTIDQDRDFSVFMPNVRFVSSPMRRDLLRAMSFFVILMYRLNLRNVVYFADRFRYLYREYGIIYTVKHCSRFFMDRLT